MQLFDKIIARYILEKIIDLHQLVSAAVHRRLKLQSLHF